MKICKITIPMIDVQNMIRRIPTIWRYAFDRFSAAKTALTIVGMELQATSAPNLITWPEYEKALNAS